MISTTSSTLTMRPLARLMEHAVNKNNGCLHIALGKCGSDQGGKLINVVVAGKSLLPGTPAMFKDLLIFSGAKRDAALGFSPTKIYKNNFLTVGNRYKILQCSSQ